MASAGDERIQHGVDYDSIMLEKTFLAFTNFKFKIEKFVLKFNVSNFDLCLSGLRRGAERFSILCCTCSTY